MQIAPKLFVYKPTKIDPVETAVHAGFIAQNVMGVIPQAVTTEPDGYFSLDATAILAATVNSVKQLKALSDRQAAEIARLNEINARLASSLSQQSAALDRLGARLAAVERRTRTRTARN